MLLQILKDRAASSDNAGNAVPNDQVLAEDSQAYFLGQQRPNFGSLSPWKEPSNQTHDKKKPPEGGKAFSTS
jgi:hypothetical protein